MATVKIFANTMEVKQRRKVAAISSCDDTNASPIAYRAPKPSQRRLSSPNKSIPSTLLCNNALGRRKISESSLDFSEHQTGKGNKSTVNSKIVKNLALFLLLGLAVGLLFSLSGAVSVANRRNVRSLAFPSLSRRLSVVEDADNEERLLLEDVLVKNLAQDNQKQELEIQNLKQQVKYEQQQQENKETLMIATREQLQEQKARRERLVAEQKEKADQAFFEATQHVEMTVEVKHRSSRKKERARNTHTSSGLRGDPSRTKL